MSGKKEKAKRKAAGRSISDERAAEIKRHEDEQSEYEREKKDRRSSPQMAATVAAIAGIL